MYILFFVISLLSSIAGTICGIGGGVIIKPVIDATGLIEVAAVSFLSGCTVLTMSAVSVGRSLGSKDRIIELKTGTVLAVGAAVGGVLGKELFQFAYANFADRNTVGAVQSGVLLVVTVLTLVYTINKNRIKTYHVKGRVLCGMIGLGMGAMSAFLGIGGGPINLMLLAFFFSMGTKQAAAYSLYIILFSQMASFFSTLVKGTVPDFSVWVLVLMILGGISGALIGGKINRRISEEQVSKLFGALMLLIMGINIYNLWTF